MKQEKSHLPQLSRWFSHKKFAEVFLTSSSQAHGSPHHSPWIHWINYSKCWCKSVIVWGDDEMRTSVFANKIRICVVMMMWSSLLCSLVWNLEWATKSTQYLKGYRTGIELFYMNTASNNLDIGDKSSRYFLLWISEYIRKLIHACCLLYQLWNWDWIKGWRNEG